MYSAGLAFRSSYCFKFYPKPISSMKASLKIYILVLAAFFAVENLSAQTLKWEYSNTNHAQILGWAGDGKGALAVIEFSTPDNFSGRSLVRAQRDIAVGAQLAAEWGERIHGNRAPHAERIGRPLQSASRGGGDAKERLAAV
jgi:hypothetical protein